MSGGINVVFNGGKNNAVFYTNSRVVIFQGKNVLKKGSYLFGGKIITIDGGKTVNSESVFSNLTSLI